MMPGPGKSPARGTDHEVDGWAGLAAGLRELLRDDRPPAVRVQAADGRFLAWAAYSPSSSIRLRAWSFDEAERIASRFRRFW